MRHAIERRKLPSNRSMTDPKCKHSSDLSSSLRTQGPWPVPDNGGEFLIKVVLRRDDTRDVRNPHMATFSESSAKNVPNIHTEMEIAVCTVQYSTNNNKILSYFLQSITVRIE